METDAEAVANRLLDLALEDGETRGPLGGFFPADLPVPSLQQALSPVAAPLPHLHPETGRTVKLARKKAKRAPRGRRGPVERVPTHDA